jgi:hypothetical protein
VDDASAKRFIALPPKRVLDIVAILCSVAALVGLNLGYQQGFVTHIVNAVLSVAVLIFVALHSHMESKKHMAIDYCWRMDQAAKIFTDAVHGDKRALRWLLRKINEQSKRTGIQKLMWLGIYELFLSCSCYNWHRIQADLHELYIIQVRRISLRFCFTPWH